MGPTLALQLPFSEVSALSGSLVSSAPERPCDDVCGLNTPSRESDGNAANFLDRPTDQWRRGDALAFAGGRRLVFLGGGLARCRIAAIRRRRASPGTHDGASHARIGSRCDRAELGFPGFKTCLGWPTTAFNR